MEDSGVVMSSYENKVARTEWLPSLTIGIFFEVLIPNLKHFRCTKYTKPTSRHVEHELESVLSNILVPIFALVNL